MYEISGFWLLFEMSLVRIVAVPNRKCSFSIRVLIKSPSDSLQAFKINHFQNTKKNNDLILAHKSEENLNSSIFILRH